MGKLLKNYKCLECEIFGIPLKHVSDHGSVLFQFEGCNFKTNPNIYGGAFL